MPEVFLQLRLLWKKLAVDKIHDDNTLADIDVSDLNEYDLATRISEGKLPVPWNSVLSQLPQADEFEIYSRPIEGFHLARYFSEQEEDDKKAYDEWLKYTYPTWIAHEKEKMPGAKGFPDRFDSRHLRFSARSLMNLMPSGDIHDVFYSDDLYAEWDWKQRILYHLQPSKV